jgi:hypothetical protein
MNTQINEGALVQLNSGSPVLTVGDIYGDNNTCTVSWYQNGEIKVADIPLACLTLYTNKGN